MSKELKAMLCYFLDIMEMQARETKNPIDDIIVRGLKAMLGCPIKPQAPKQSMN